MSFEIIETETRTERPTNIYVKLRDIQQKLQAPKGQYNKDANFSYRSAEDILGAVKPLLDAQSLILTLDDDMIQMGDRYYVKATAKVTDTESGDAVETHAWAREEISVSGMRESQITGASSSYARKYAMNGLFAIDDVKDADATNKGKGKPASAQTGTSQNPQRSQIAQNVRTPQNVQNLGHAPAQSDPKIYQPQAQPGGYTQKAPQPQQAQQAQYRPQQAQTQDQYRPQQAQTQNQPGSGFQIHRS